MHLEDPLDGFLGDAREAVRAEADRGGRRRDFAAMIARAHAIDSQGVSREAVAEAAQFAPVVALPRPRIAPAPAREEVPAATPAVPRRKLGWLMAAAAGLLLAGAFAGAATQARRDDHAGTANAAPLVAPQPDPSSATATPPPGAGAQRHVFKSSISPAESADGHDSEDMFTATGIESSAVPAASEPGHVSKDMLGEGAGETAHAHKDMSVATGDSGTAPRRRGIGPRRRAEQPPAEAATDEAAWVALDRAAREAWRRGDTEEARALLAALVRTDAAASTVELAYGDLFVLTRKAGDQQALARLWQRYLARFPRGLYAEDARVGLCRRASGAEASACWNLYLGTWPEGAHADEARAARGSEEP